VAEAAAAVVGVMDRSPLFLPASNPQQSSALAIEYMNSYKENEKRKDGAKIQFCALFA
jgi:hypothetical protein